jgi:hypothetical protein
MGRPRPVVADATEDQYEAGRDFPRLRPPEGYCPASSAQPYA